VPLTLSTLYVITFLSSAYSKIERTPPALFSTEKDLTPAQTQQLVAGCVYLWHPGGSNLSQSGAHKRPVKISPLKVGKRPHIVQQKEMRLTRARPLLGTDPIKKVHPPTFQSVHK